MQKINVSVPGRICLFGEHQDYLKLPVITAAINLRIAVSGSSFPGRQIFLDLPDINSHDSFKFPENGQEVAYRKERDYFRSVFNVIMREGIHLDHGFHCQVRGNIPINSGTSSSSALNIAWAFFLLLAGNAKLSDYPPEKVAYLAYLAEVVEFGEPGGMMDHFATAIGGTLFIDFAQPVRTEKLMNPKGTFVLGDSRQPKDTKRILKRVKEGVLDAVGKIQKENVLFDLKNCPQDELSAYKSLLTDDQRTVLHGTLINRDITAEAYHLFNSSRFDDITFGKLLTAHHEILSSKLDISTEKIDRMLQNARQAGAYGGKINGSGGGGCMFVYAPENTQGVKTAIEKTGGIAYIVNIDEGARIESNVNKS
jgi:galactokinase